MATNRPPSLHGRAAALLAQFAALAVFVALVIAAPALADPNPRVQKLVDEALARQDQMVGEALGKVAPQQPGVRDIYFVGIAGWGDQHVFRREVRAVRSLFEKSFGAQGRAVSLVNHRETLNQVPLATHRTIEATIMGVAEVMDPEEDLLVLFMTSHGVEWDGFSLFMNDTSLGDLKGAQLARILGAARIKNRIVVVSACYSGQFVPALAEENTLLITAAASDRTSFGCTNTAEWTYFGRAFFRDALPRHKNFVKAFEEAKDKITAREKREGFEPSVPQLRVGARLRAVLNEMGL